MLKVLEIMAQHSAELVSELTDQLPLLLFEGARPAVPAQRLLLKAQFPEYRRLYSDREHAGPEPSRVGVLNHFLNIAGPISVGRQCPIGQHHDSGRLSVI